jgi:hypothetical protein
MGKLHKKIVHALQSQLKDLEDALDDLPGGRVSGVVISSSFNRLTHKARQAKLMAILKKAPTSAEMSSVGAVAALTPAEAHVKAV